MSGEVNDVESKGTLGWMYYFCETKKKCVHDDDLGKKGVECKPVINDRFRIAVGLLV